LTQEELAEHAGLSARGVSDLERGIRRTPHPDTTRRLADALGLDDGEREELLGSVDRAAPSPSAAPAPLSALPISLTSFIGRGAELAEIQRLLSTTRLLTLTGTGGVGRPGSHSSLHDGLRATTRMVRHSRSCPRWRSPIGTASGRQGDWCARAARPRSPGRARR
jgi:transcriptional regulator with XRE-family HTH domain